MTKSVEREINTIRLTIHEEIKDMTYEQRKERLQKIVNAAEKEFGFTRLPNTMAIYTHGA
jgi:hypothetical protein